MWKDFVRNYLSFTRAERKAIVLLCLLIALCWISPFVVNSFKKRADQDSAFKEEVALFKARQDSLRKKLSYKPVGDKGKEENILNINDLPPPFPFDPNQLSSEGWQKLGVPLYLIHTIQHYRAAGGHFYKKEDLKKIYGLPISLYRHLEPYIKIKEAAPEKTVRKVYSHNNEKDRKKATGHKKVIVDINVADSAQWTKLYGIGPVLSIRIVRFRNALGGFYNIDQIAEVYGLADSTFQRIKQQLKITDVHLKKININKATVEKMKSHPYINYPLANAIKAFREMHGSFDSVEGLKQLQLVNDQIYRKLAPYLTVKQAKNELSSK